eukprot:Lankesteria_metandrocarpae@DN6673_c0_g1_i1.p1
MHNEFANSSNCCYINFAKGDLNLAKKYFQVYGMGGMPMLDFVCDEKSWAAVNTMQMYFGQIPQGMYHVDKRCNAYHSVTNANFCEDAAYQYPTYYKYFGAFFYYMFPDSPYTVLPNVFGSDFVKIIRVANALSLINMGKATMATTGAVFFASYLTHVELVSLTTLNVNRYVTSLNGVETNVHWLLEHVSVNNTFVRASVAYLALYIVLLRKAYASKLIFDGKYFLIATFLSLGTAGYGALCTTCYIANFATKKLARIRFLSLDLNKANTVYAWHKKR